MMQTLMVLKMLMHYALANALLCSFSGARKNFSACSVEFLNIYLAAELSVVSLRVCGTHLFLKYLFMFCSFNDIFCYIAKCKRMINYSSNYRPHLFQPEQNQWLMQSLSMFRNFVKRRAKALIRKWEKASRSVAFIFRIQS